MALPLVAVLLGLLAALAPGAAAAATPTSGPPSTVTSAPGSPGSPTAVPASGGLALRAVTPGVVTRESGLTVTGVLTAGAGALTDPRVSLVRGGSLLTTRQAVTDWSGSSDAVTGARFASASPVATLAPGAGVAFTLTVPAGGLHDAAPFGVLPVAVEVSSAAGTTSLHTFVGWYSRKEYEQLGVAVVAPLTLPADTALYADDDAVRARAWQRDLGPGARLDRMMAGTDVPGVPVTWAVDPAVIGPTTTTTTTTTTTAGGGPTPGDPPSGGSTPAPAATDPGGATTTDVTTDVPAVTAAQQRLATRLADGATRHPVWALPYADPDLAATLGSPSDPGVTTQIRRAHDLAGRLGASGLTSGVTSGVAWPADGDLQADREAALGTAYGSGLRGTLVSSSTLPSTSGLSATGPHRSPSGLAVVGWDDAMSTLTTRTRTPQDGVLATQELVAQTATLLGQSPGLPRRFLVAIPRTVDPSPEALRSMLSALAVVPWVHLVAADSLLTDAASGDGAVTSLAPSTWPVPASAVTPALRRRVAAVRPSLEAVAALLPSRSDDRGRWQDTLDQVTSTRWRGHPADPVALTDAADRWSLTVTSGIRVLGQDTNFLADEGILQVTVVNDLAEPVTGLRLRLSPGNPRLRVLEQPAPFPIAARSRAIVKVRVRAVAAGLVPVTVSLESTGGLAVGTSAQLNIRANPPGRAFYLGSGAVLVVLLLFGVHRAVRQRRRQPTGP